MNTTFKNKITIVFTIILSLAMISCSNNEPNDDEIQEIRSEIERLKATNDSLITVIDNQSLSTLVFDPYQKKYKNGDSLELYLQVGYSQQNLTGQILATNRTSEDSVVNIINNSNYYNQFDLSSTRNVDGSAQLKVYDLRKGINVIGGVYILNQGQEVLPFVYTVVCDE